MHAQGRPMVSGLQDCQPWILLEEDVNSHDASSFALEHVPTFQALLHKRVAHRRYNVERHDEREKAEPDGRLECWEGRGRCQVV